MALLTTRIEKNNFAQGGEGQIAKIMRNVVRGLFTRMQLQDLNVCALNGDVLLLLQSSMDH